VKPATTRFAYDVFVVHAIADDWFVQGYLLPKAGLAAERVLVLAGLCLGELITSEIERGVRSSRVTIVVLSSAYMDDHWAEFAEQIAAYESVAKDSHGVLLPLLLEPCGLPTHIRALVKLDFRDPARSVWQAEVDRLRTYLDRPVSSEPELSCPYPGMRPFTRDDAARFFGRDVELDRIIRRLQRGEREIYVIGASGSGKSSLIAAGLVPRLARGVAGLPCFHVLTIRPGERPLDRLAAALEGDLAAPAAAVGSLLACHAPAASLFLVIDQLEELFAIASADQRRGFLAAMRAIRADPRCVLVFTLRADFYGIFMDSPLWTDRGISRIDLGPLRSDSLRTVIERPARDLGVYFQPELASRLLDDAAREPGALPLLQETLFQLWGKRRQRLLALADYHALGGGDRTGLAFAVEEHADDVLGTLTSVQKAVAFRILLRLVNFGEGRADTRRQQLRDDLRSIGEDVADFDAVLQHLVDNRLVTVTGDDEGGDIRVDLAHEILIHSWSSFGDWIRNWRAHEQHRREIEAAATAWRGRGSGDGGLLDPVELADALSWQERAGYELGYTTDLAALLASSQAAQARAIHRQQRELAEHNRRLAESSQFYQELAWQRLLEAGRPLEALPYLVAAREATEAGGGTPSSSLRMLFAQATRNLPLSPPLQHRGSVVKSAFSPDGTRIVTASWDKTARVWDAATGLPLCFALGHKDRVVSAAFSPDGECVVTASWDKTARVWDAAFGLALSSPLPHRDHVMSAEFSPDGTRVVTASKDHTARVWDAASSQPLSPPLAHNDCVVSAVFSPDGTRVVTASKDRTARVWEAASGQPLSPPLAHNDCVVSAVFSPDGTRVATASKDHTARVWDAASGQPLLPPLAHNDCVVSAAFSPDGTRVVTACKDHTARVWDVASGQPLSPPLKHQDAVVSAAFSPDGIRVVTAGKDRTARVWDAASGTPVSSPLAHQDAVVSAAFSPDGTRVVTASADYTARVWNTDSGTPSWHPLVHHDSVANAAFSPGGTRVVTTRGGRIGRFWDTGKPCSSVLQHQDAVASTAFSPDGMRVVTASWDRTARVWDAASGEPLSPPLTHQDSVVSAVFSPDGTRVVTASWDRTARVWDAAVGKPLSPPLTHQDSVVSVAFSPDGARLITASWDHTARVWDAATGHPVSPRLAHQSFVESAAFSPDGTRVVTASWDHTARIWDATTGNPLSPALVHEGAVTKAVFSPDGTRVLTASADHTARIWDAASGKPLSPALSHQGSVYISAFSRDGTRVVTASADHTARIWDAASGKPLSPPLAHQGAVVSAAFSSDCARVVTASWDGTARVWDAATGKALSPSLEHQDNLSCAAFNVHGTRVVTASNDHTARLWDLPLAQGTLEEWRAIVDRASPYVLVNGVLQPRARPALERPEPTNSPGDKADYPGERQFDFAIDDNDVTPILEV
jgi:WD40 repeat protein